MVFKHRVSLGLVCFIAAILQEEVIHTFQQFPFTIFLLNKQCSVLALPVLT